MSGSLFQLPDELLLTPIFQSFPCRERQIRSLATLLYPPASPCRNLTIHGVPSTGKTAITSALLSTLSLTHAFVPAAQCITPRHFFERILSLVAAALELPSPPRCETLSQLNVELCQMLKYDNREGRPERFVLVFDAVDRVRDAPVTLLPALARLSEIIPCLTVIFILTAPLPLQLATSPSPSLHFPPYSKPDFIAILSLTPPVNPIPTTTLEETHDLWPRFCAAVHDALVQSAARSLPSFRNACTTLWPHFTAPIAKGLYGPKDFSKLLVASRAHFKDESVLNPSIICAPTPTSTTTTTASTITPTTAMAVANKQPGTELSSLLPRTARIILMCAYLASHNAARHDITLFSTHHAKKRRRRGGAASASGDGNKRSKHRKIARKLLGAHAFVLERMLAIYAAVRTEWTDEDDHLGSSRARSGRGGILDGDVGMAIGTLASLRLLNRVGGGASGGSDLMDRGGKWRINVGWEVLRGVGRSIGVEVEEWLID